MCRGLIEMFETPNLTLYIANIIFFFGNYQTNNILSYLKNE